MSFLGVLAVRRAVADVAVDDDQCGLVGGLTENVESFGRARSVSLASVTCIDVPAVAFEARAHVFAEGQAGVAFDGDVVVVVDPAEIGEFEVAGEGSGFAGNAFHHVAVAADGVNAVIENARNRGLLK